MAAIYEKPPSYPEVFPKLKPLSEEKLLKKFDNFKRGQNALEKFFHLGTSPEKMAKAFARFAFNSPVYQDKIENLSQTFFENFGRHVAPFQEHAEITKIANWINQVMQISEQYTNLKFKEFNHIIHDSISGRDSAITRTTKELSKCNCGDKCLCGSGCECGPDCECCK